MRPFRAIPASTVSVSATTTTARAAFRPAGEGEAQVRVHNVSSNPAFIRFGSSTVVAVTTTDLPVPAGAVEVFSIQADESHIAAIMASGTATVYATLGAGI